MGNAWFQFRQFKIVQEKASMKVTTDACLFGALLPVIKPTGPLTVLDIGTGTGLLALMYAQKHANAQITGIEIDEAASEEACLNVSQSPWNNRITILKGDILEHSIAHGYDLIFCNPPFHEKQLQSPNSPKNIAHHSSALSLQALLLAIKGLLTRDGMCCLLLPHYREGEVQQLAGDAGLFATTCIRVKQSPANSYFRSIIYFSTTPPTQVEYQSIHIRDINRQYSPAFTALLQPYYLYL